ncbi:metallophosphoesterase family protein [Halogranum gelatinilyticum]|nr:metallophosphoesterase family protein [Halogranum gelatinilyticum]
MKLGLISDVHGNLPALEAVLEDLPAVDMIACAGDVVGYNPWPADCVERVREVAAITVVGNHDRAVGDRESFRANSMALAGIEYAREELSDEQKDWLAELPRKATLADGSILLVHDHPTVQDRYVFPRHFPEVRPHIDEYDGAVLGHTHRQHKARIDGRLIVNPGSVGQPRDGDSDAAYAVLDTDALEVELHRVEYDINRVIERVEEAGLPPEIGTRLLDGS